METTTQELINHLEKKEHILEKKLGDTRMALRALRDDKEDVLVVEKRGGHKRTHITNELREKYSDEVVAVLKAYGSLTAQEIMDRGSFGTLSVTSIARLAKNHPSIERTQHGKAFKYTYII